MVVNINKTSTILNCQEYLVHLGHYKENEIKDQRKQTKEEAYEDRDEEKEEQKRRSLFFLLLVFPFGCWPYFSSL